MSDTTQPDVTIARIAADIVVAFVSRNPIDAGDVASLTLDVKAALMSHDKMDFNDARWRETPPENSGDVSHEFHLPEERPSRPAREVGSKSQQPAVPISKSVTHDHIFCLEDGRKFRSLKRHLRHEHNMTPEQYREKWGLPQHYQMVAPSYSTVRTNLAKEQGLGTSQTKRKTRAEKGNTGVVQEAAE